MIKKLFHRINSMYNMSFGLFAAFISDYNEYRTSHSNKFTLANDERSILLLSHALEKGMSFTNKRPNWGGVKALTLCKASGYFINKCYVNTTNSNYHMTYNTSKGYSASYSYSSSKTYYLLMDTFGYDYYVYGKGYNSSYNLELIASLSETRYARDMMVDYVRNGGLAS